MIISNVIGGLGNQMFQYAAARSIAQSLGVPLKLDTSSFENYFLHNGFELSRVFNVRADFASDKDLKEILTWQRYRLIKRILLKEFFAILRKENFVVEPHFEYWTGVESVRNNSYLFGYWQSEKYFKTNEEIIRNEFEFKVPFIGLNRINASNIENCNSVSIHIRRADYVKNSVNLRIHGVCPLTYYYQAITHIANKVGEINLYVFSDDFEWVAKNLKLDHPFTYIDNNKGIESYNDMHLMSLCKHNIIANSSFSWWAAWLNSNEKKIVVAPRKWFVDKKRNTRDLLPVSWIAI